MAKALATPAYVPHRTQKSYDRRKRVTVERRTPMLPGFVFVLTHHPRAVRVEPSKHRYGFMRLGNGSFAFLTQRAFELLQAVEASFLVVPAPAAQAAPVPSSPKSPVLVAGTGVIFKHEVFGELRAVIKQLRGDRALIEALDNAALLEVQLGALNVA